MGSANGTLLNGARITGKRELASGDSVAVGPVVLAFATLTVDDIRAAAARAGAANKPLRPALAEHPPGVTERTRTEETQVVFDDSSPGGLVAVTSGPVAPGSSSPGPGPAKSVPAPSGATAVPGRGPPPLPMPASSGPGAAGVKVPYSSPAPGVSGLSPALPRSVSAPHAPGVLGLSPALPRSVSAPHAPGVSGLSPALPRGPSAPASPGVSGLTGVPGRFSELLEAASDSGVKVTPPGPPPPVEQQETRFIVRPFPAEAPPDPVRAAEVAQQETLLRVPAYGPGEEEITNAPTGGAALAQKPTIPLPAGIADPGPDEGTVSEAGPRPLSAAERARKRRQAGETLGGQLGYFWSEMPRSGKAVAVGLLLAIFGGTGGSLWVLFGPGDGPKLGAEGTRLGPEPLVQSFGLGDEVQFERPDMKIFQFEFTVPTQAVAILHYQAADISQGEVSIILNGVEQGLVPPDTNLADRELEQVLSPRDLKRNATNQVTFDNLKNPPGHEPWRIASPWIEVIPVPDLPAPELLARAHEFARRGKEFLDLRDVGSDNLFKAWKSYRQAWITLVALPEASRPELYDFVAEQRAVLGRELDQKCRTLMLDAKRSMQLKNPDKALEALEDVARYFPTTEHRCHNLALRTMNEYEL